LGIRWVNICSMPYPGFAQLSNTRFGGGDLKIGRIPREPFLIVLLLQSNTNMVQRREKTLHLECTAVFKKLKNVKLILVLMDSGVIADTRPEKPKSEGCVANCRDRQIH